MFEFRTGLPGSGKTLSLVRDIYYRLVTTDRMIGTTLTELDPARLAAYIARKHPGRNFNVERRLFFIPKEETSTFYRFRGLKTFDRPPSFVKTASQEEKDAACSRYFAQFAGLPGVDYFITEAHRFFRADTWSEMADIVTFYASQHRHLDDNVCIETQVPKMVVVQFRDLAEICVEMQNHYRQRFGMFQKIGRFVAVYYYGVPKPGTKGEESHRTTFLLDKEGLASCYATRGAIVGVGGATPETQNIKKGLPFWLLPTAILCALVLVSWGIMHSGRAFQWVTRSVFGGFMGTTEKAVKAIAPDMAGVTPKPSLVAPQPSGTPGNSDPATEPKTVVRLRSVSLRGRDAIFVLSDGTVMTTETPELLGARYDRMAGRLTLKDGTTYTLIR